MAYNQYTNDDNSVNLKNDATGLYLDGNTKGNVYTLPPNDSAFQRWRFYDLKIINVATGRALDLNYEGRLYTLPPRDRNFQNWIHE